MMDVTKLAAEFPRDAIHWRAQTLTRNGDKALALAYLDARDVMDRLDEVCGPENWQDEYVESAKGRVICRIGVRLESGWVWKSDGAGDTAVEGEKGGISDAFKRAAVKWGIGRYLYRLDSVWAPCETYEKGGKKYWSGWKGSPWDSVRSGGKQTPPPQPSAPKAVERDPRKIADGLIGLFEAAPDADKVQAIRGKNSAALDWLATEAPPMSNEVMAAQRRAMQRLGMEDAA